MVEYSPRVEVTRDFITADQKTRIDSLQGKYSDEQASGSRAFSHSRKQRTPDEAAVQDEIVTFSLDFEFSCLQIGMDNFDVLLTLRRKICQSNFCIVDSDNMLARRCQTEAV